LKPTIDIEEKKLIQRCCKGNPKAQFDLYKKYHNAMYNVALRILVDTAEAEDVMQEAFLTAFDKISTFSAEVSFGAWVKRIVINKSLDALRKRKMHFEEIDERSTTLISEEEEVDEQMYRVASIQKALSQISESHRILISMHLFEGYPHEEIAQILNMKHGAVRTAYARAKKKLQDEIKKINSVESI